MRTITMHMVPHSYTNTNIHANRHANRHAHRHAHIHAHIPPQWSGTKIETWLPADSTDVCGHKSFGNLRNAMIVPYSVG